MTTTFADMWDRRVVYSSLPPASSCKLPAVPALFTRVLVWSVRRPFPAAALFALITLGFALQLPRLEIDPSNEGLMLERDPARQHYEQVKATFGSDELTVVVLKADDVFAPAVLEATRRLSQALERIPGVTRVDSLSTVDNIAAHEDTLEIAPLLRDGAPTDAEAIARIRRQALENPVFTGNLVAADGKAAGILLFTQADPADREFNTRFSRQVDEILAGESVPGLTLYQIGGPLIKATMVEFVRQDQITLIPFSAATLFIVLLIAFRTPQGVVAPIVTGLASIIWGVGLMAIFRVPINVVTVAVPSLVLVIGFAEAVHIMSAYHRLLREGHDKMHALTAAVEEAALPILVTTATTVFAFATLIVTDITMLKQFGYAATLALSANFAATLLGMPLLLRLWPEPRRVRRHLMEEGPVADRTFGRIAAVYGVILRRRVPIVAAFAVLALASLWGWYSLRVDTDFTSYFPESSIVRQRLNDADLSLAGASAFFVVIDTGRDNGMTEPVVLRQIAALQTFIEGIPGVDKTVSIVDYVSQLHAKFGGQPGQRREVPDRSETIAQHLLIMERAQTERFIDLPASSGNIVVRHNLNGSWELSQALRRIETYTAENMGGLDVRPAGQAVLTSRAADYMAINEVTSFVYTLAIIGIIHSALFLSVKAGLLSLIPNVVPVLYVFGVMGLLGIPLSTGTALVATIAIGIAVDDTVHNMIAYSRQLNIHRDERTAVLHTMAIQSRPVIFISLALAAGFGVMAFSNFVPTVHLALLSAFVMIAAMISELVLSPILMASTRLVTLWDMVLLRMNPELVRTAPLLEGLSKWEARKVVLMGMLRSLNPGDYVIRRGEQGRELFMVVTGRVVVMECEPDGSERTLAIVDAGGVFGETGIVADAYRTFSARAETATELLRLDFAAFERLRRRFPYTAAKVFRNLARILSERLQDTTTAMLFLSATSRKPLDDGAPTLN